MTQVIINNAYSIGSTSSSTSPFVTYFSTSAPLISNNRFPIGKRWVNISTGSEYILAPSGQWITLTTADANFNTFTGNTGTVPPTFGNINILGDISTVSLNGNPGTSTLTARVVLPVTQHSVLEKSSSGIGGITPSSTAGVPLVSQGSSADSLYSTMVVAGGGIGKDTQAAYSLVTAGITTTSPFQEIGPSSSSNALLISTGSSSLPSFSETADVYISGISLDAGTFTLNIYRDKNLWTPALRFGATTTTTYSIQTGIYSRLNAIVFLHFELQIATLPAQSGIAQLITLPNVIQHPTSFLQLYYENLILPVGTKDVCLRLNTSPVINFVAVGSGGTTTLLDFTNFTSNTYLSTTGNYSF